MRKLVPFLLILISLSAQSADPLRFETKVIEYEKQNPPAGALVITGSSTIEIWTTMAADLSPLVTVNRGMAGAQVPDIAYWLDRLVLAEKPKSVALYVGDNDVNAGAAVQTIVNGLKDLTVRIHASYPQAMVYLLGIKPSIARWSQWPKSTEVNNLLKAFAGTDPRYRYIDTSAKLLGSDGKPIASMYNADGLHLNSSGYKAWTAMVKPTLVDGESTAGKVPKPPTDVRSLE